MPVKIDSQVNGARFGIKVVPGASRDRIVGLLGDVLKIAVSSPPEGGKANQAVLSLLCRHLGVKRHQLSIERGTTSPHKQVGIVGMSAEQLQQKLAEFEKS